MFDLNIQHYVWLVSILIWKCLAHVFLRYYWHCLHLMVSVKVETMAHHITFLFFYSHIPSFIESFSNCAESGLACPWHLALSMSTSHNVALITLFSGCICLVKLFFFFSFPFFPKLFLLHESCSHQWPILVGFNSWEPLNHIRHRWCCWRHSRGAHLWPPWCPCSYSRKLHVPGHSIALFLPFIREHLPHLEHHSHVHYWSICKRSVCTDNNSSICWSGYTQFAEWKFPGTGDCDCDHRWDRVSGGSNRTTADGIHLSQELECRIHDADGGSTYGRAAVDEARGGWGLSKVWGLKNRKATTGSCHRWSVDEKKWKKKKKECVIVHPSVSLFALRGWTLDLGPLSQALNWISWRWDLHEEIGSSSNNDINGIKKRVITLIVFILQNNIAIDVSVISL